MDSVIAHYGQEKEGQHLANIAAPPHQGPEQQEKSHKIRRNNSREQIGGLVRREQIGVRVRFRFRWGNAPPPPLDQDCANQDNFVE